MIQSAASALLQLFTKTHIWVVYRNCSYHYWIIINQRWKSKSQCTDQAVVVVALVQWLHSAWYDVRTLWLLATHHTDNVTLAIHLSYTQESCYQHYQLTSGTEFYSSSITNSHTVKHTWWIFPKLCHHCRPVIIEELWKVYRGRYWTQTTSSWRHTVQTACTRTRKTVRIKWIDKTHENLPDEK